MKGVYKTQYHIHTKFNFIMKQLNLWKTLFYTMLTIAAAAFTACVDDDVDKQSPSLELS